LFCGRDCDLYEERGNWQEQEQKFKQRRQQIVSDILQSEGLEGLIHFAEFVDSPRQVGYSLGSIEFESIESRILPYMLDSETEAQAAFVEGFVSGRFHSQGWTWFDGVIQASWTDNDKGQILLLLPFKFDTWKRVDELLAVNRQKYWQAVDVNPYEAGEHLHYAIDCLLDHKRPWAAIDCLARQVDDNDTIDSEKAIKALLDAVSSSSELEDTYGARRIIKALQKNGDVEKDKLLKVEWAYLRLLQGHHEAEPVTLESRLASDPEFFVKVLGLMYRSEKDTKKNEKPSESEKSLAENAWWLLKAWKTLPGSTGDDEFSAEQFRQWIATALQLAEDSGHKKAALRNIGNVLIHSPADPGGLWIHTAVAEVLNHVDYEEMRSGYSIATFNARGAHFVDPSGRPEYDLAEKYRRQADDVENSGYHRFAATLRNMAKSYEREAGRIVKEHRKENSET
jgi:hypothetical protein